MAKTEKNNFRGSLLLSALVLVFLLAFLIALVAIDPASEEQRDVPKMEIPKGQSLKGTY